MRPRFLYRHCTTVLTLIGICCLFAHQALTQHLGSGHDDEYIFLSSGCGLIQNGWFYNVNGQPEDMVSSPLTGLLAWTSCYMGGPQAALAWFKLEGLLAATVAALLLSYLAHKLLPNQLSNPVRALLCILPTLGLSLTPSWMYWSMGGMETPYQALYFLLLIADLHKCHKDPANPSYRWVLTTLLCFAPLIRVEGIWVAWILPLFTPYTANGTIQKRIASYLALMLPASLCFLLVSLLRLKITGAFWPNPVLAKQGESQHLLALGLNYWTGFNTSSPLITILNIVNLSVLACFRLRRHDANPSLSAAACLALGQDLLCIAGGGNWMTHYRLLVPALPLKLLASFCGVMYLPSPLKLRLALTGVICLSFTLLHTQSGLNPNYPYLSTATPVPWATVRLDNMNALQTQMENSSQPHRRDIENLLPFIETQLQPLLASHGPLCIVSYQMGFFPWKLRQHFTPEQILIVDTMGLNNRLISSIPGPRDSLGLQEGSHIDQMLLKHPDTLSRLCEGRAPELVYQITANPKEIFNMAQMGYHPIWEKPNAVIFSRL
jgi:hypothetical protein